MPKFRFDLNFEDSLGKASFQEVSGLDVDSESTVYQHGADPDFSTINMPGLRPTSEVTLKRGLLPSASDFWKWCEEVKLNTVQRKNVQISLINEDGQPMMSWTLANALPIKIEAAKIESAGHEVAIETMVVAHEGIVINKA